MRLCVGAGAGRVVTAHLIRLATSVFGSRILTAFDLAIDAVFFGADVTPVEECDVIDRLSLRVLP